MKPIQKAKKTQTLPDIGTKLKIKNKIRSVEECGGFFVKSTNLTTRRFNQQAEYAGWVPGSGGDIWWVKHTDGTIGAYCVDELTDV